MTLVQCDRVFVSVAHQTTGVRLLTLPAYTVPTDDLAERITKLTDEYFATTRDLDTPVSLSDFALFITGRASRDPFEQERAT